MQDDRFLEDCHGMDCDIILSNFFYDVTKKNKIKPMSIDKTRQNHQVK